MSLVLQVQSAAAPTPADAKAAGLLNGNAEAKPQLPQTRRVQLRPKQSPGTDAHSSLPHVTEPSEEELLQWQPVFPAKKLPLKLGTSAKSRIPSQQPVPVSTAVPDMTRAQQPVSGDSSPTSSLAATSISAIGGIPASVLGSKKADVAPAAASKAAGTMGADPSLSSVTTPTPDLPFSQSPPSAAFSAASAVPAGSAQLSMGSELSVSTGRHALPAEPAMLLQHRTSAMPPQSGVQGYFSSTAAPAAAAASLSASVDSDWLAMPAPETRQSISSRSSEAADAQALRHSIASGSTSLIHHTDADALTGLQGPVTAGSDAVTSCDGTYLLSGAPVQWHLLNTEELQAQTAALLSSVATSTDWDTVGTDASSHRQMAGTGIHTQPAQQKPALTDAHIHSIPDMLSLSDSLESELLPSIPDVPSVHAPAAASLGSREMPVGRSVGLTASSSRSLSARSSRFEQGGGLQRRAPAGHSPASSVALSEPPSSRNIDPGENDYMTLGQHGFTSPNTA